VDTSSRLRPTLQRSADFFSFPGDRGGGPCVFFFRVWSPPPPRLENSQDFLCPPQSPIFRRRSFFRRLFLIGSPLSCRRILDIFSGSSHFPILNVYSPVFCVLTGQVFPCRVKKPVAFLFCKFSSFLVIPSSSSSCNFPPSISESTIRRRLGIPPP